MEERGRLIEEDAGSIGSEKVLIEKDGVFELVSTSEVHAGESVSKIDASEKEATNTDDPLQSHPNTTQSDMSTSEERAGLAESNTRDYGPVQSARENVANETVQQQATDHSDLSDKQDRQNDQLTSVDSSVPETDQSAKGDNDDRPITQDATESSTPPSTSVDVAAPSSPSIQKASQLSNQSKSLASKSVVVSSNHQKKSNTKSSTNVPRTTSAPSSRLPDKKLTTAEEEEKQRLNEQAFQAWLSKKNKEIVQRLKQEKLKEKKSEEEIDRKKEENELAYKAWLAMKHSQLIALSRSKEKKLPVINEEEEKKRIDESFETWLSQKRVQRKQEEEVGRKKTEEVEQVARKVDPEIASAAYKKLVNLKVDIISLLFFCLLDGCIKRTRKQERLQFIKRNVDACFSRKLRNSKSPWQRGRST